MSLHLFLKGNVFDYTSIEMEHDYVLNLSNDCSAESQAYMALQYWKYKDKKEKIAVITNSDFFLREINTLIMIFNLSTERRLKVISEFSRYAESLFLHKELNITAFDLEANEECSLTEFGFAYKSLDKTIDLQNKVQEYIIWAD